MTTRTVVLLLGLCGVLSGTARAQYTFTPIDVSGATSTAVNANSPHAIAGQFDDANGVTHGFVIANGVFTQVDVPGAVFTSVNGINASGDLAGIYVNDAGHILGYAYVNGTFTTLDVPGSIRTSAFFLNAKGQVVGTYRTPDNVRHGFVWSKKKGFVTIDHPDAATPAGTSVVGINDRGEVIGTYVDEEDGNRYGFVLSGGRFTTLDAPGSDGFTVGQGINNAGTAVGLYADEEGTSHGFVVDRNGYQTVDVPGAFWTEIYSVNAQGQVVGAYEDEDGVHGFVGTPTR